MRSSFDLWSVEDWEQVCGLMVVTSGDCQSCLLVLVVAGLDMVVFRTYYGGLSGKLTRLVGRWWFFFLPVSCLEAWEFEGKMVVTGQEGPPCGVFNPNLPTDLNITQFLLQLSTTNSTPTNVKDGICTSALLIKNKNTDSSTTANNITDLIKQQMDDVTRQIITKTNTLHNLVQDITSTATTIKDNAMKTVTHLNQSTPATYAAVAQAATNSEHADIIARGLNADKQLLIFTDKTLPNADPTDLTEKDLVTKANMALELMDNTPTNKLEIVSFITAKKLGNVPFQLNFTQATAWLRNPDVQKNSY